MVKDVQAKYQESETPSENTQISDNAGLLVHVYYYYHACPPHAIGVFLSSFYMYLLHIPLLVGIIYIYVWMEV